MEEPDERDREQAGTQLLQAELSPEILRGVGGAGLARLQCQLSTRGGARGGKEHAS